MDLPAVHAEQAMLRPDHILVLPLPKRMIVQYTTNDAGTRELRLFYDAKEISFDEPDLFAFGETLAKQSRFSAIEATRWGGSHPWPRIRALLSTLVDEGVLRYADDTVDEEPEHAAGDRPSPLAPATAHEARTWLECETLMRELTGRPLELGYLELAVPIFRVAHMYLDAEGRQVGESNVFPPALRLDVPTRWRACIYDGSRYQVDRPMNVTALKSMRAHWGPMMAALLRVREAYLARFPAARDGWTVGHLERLSTCVLALPTWQLMRVQNRIANGALHPVWSSLFRVTDGLRMTMHQMLFVPRGEPTLAPHAPMTSAAVLAYAERNYSFHSEHGVCAGPRMMIEEFLAVLIDGRAPKHGVPELEPVLTAALDDLGPVIDYALLGLQAYATGFSIWPLMTRTYEALGSIVDRWTTAPAPVMALRERLKGHMERVRKATYLANEAWRIDRERVYGDMYDQCALGLSRGATSATLRERLAANTPLSDGAMVHTLGALIALRLEARPRDPQVQALAACIQEFLDRTQAILRVASEVQSRTNTLLGRPQPERALAAADLDLHNRLQGASERRLPYLLDELADIFQLDFVLDSLTLRITPNTATRGENRAASSNSADIPSAESRA